jgi:hypothetical protein
MKNKLIILYCLLTLSFSTTIGQDLQHIKGLRADDISFYMTKQGYGFRAGYTMFFSTKFNLPMLFDYETGTVGYTKYSRYSLNFQPGYTILKPFKNDYLTAYIPVLAGIESLSTDELTTKQNSFMYHVGVGINNELNISSALAILIFFDQMVIGQSKLGTRYYSVGAGLRIKITNFKNKRSI